MKSKRIITLIICVLSLSLFVIIINAVSVSNDNTSLHDYSKDDEFSYDINKRYSNRQSIKNELDNLSDAFENFCDGKTDEECFENLKKYEYYKSVLNNYLTDFPKSDDDILLEKEEKLYYEFSLLDDKMTFISERYSNAKEKNELKSKYESIKSDYEKGLKIINSYEKGEISIDDALNSLGIKYTNTKDEDVSNNLN